MRLFYSKSKNIWLEITTLIIPGLNDNMNMLQKMAQFIKNELGAETPWHISQFYPDHKLAGLNPTSPAIINKICQMGRKEELKFVYSGNIPSTSYEDTYCPRCRQIMIDREGYNVMRFDRFGICSNCGEDLHLLLG